jgi:methylglyoxal synthase
LNRYHIIDTILFFLETAHSKTTTECVDEFFTLNKKYNDFMATHKQEAEALIQKFNDQVKTTKAIDEVNSICKFF